MFQFSSLIPEEGLVVELTAGGSKLLSRALMSNGSLAAVFRHDLLIYKYSADVRNVVKFSLELGTEILVKIFFCYSKIFFLLIFFFTQRKEEKSLFVSCLAY